jgi:hypothetical protein
MSGDSHSFVSACPCTNSGMKGLANTSFLQWLRRLRLLSCKSRLFCATGGTNKKLCWPQFHAKYGSPRLFEEHGTWCNLQPASCQWDVPESYKLTAAPVPSAREHCNSFDIGFESTGKYEGSCPVGSRRRDFSRMPSQINRYSSATEGRRQRDTRH